MTDQETTTNLSISLQTSGKGIEVLAITAGIGNGWNFPPAVLRASLSLWDRAECYTDHVRAQHDAPAHHSVRDLGGVLSAPSWDEPSQGVRAVLTPAGPAAQVIRDLAEAALSHPELPIGLSADILMRVDGKTVLEIVKVKSLDAVTHPARGGKFVRVLQSVGAGFPRPSTHSQGEETMSEELETPSTPPPAAPVADDHLTENTAALQTILGEQERQAKLQAQIAASDALLSEQCKYLLTSALAASHLPEVTQARLRRSFEGTVFQPAALQAAIDDARAEVKALTGSLAVAGPGRISNMITTEDQLQVAVDDLLGVPRDPAQAGLKVARLSGIRELYLMLTGDANLHGGIFPQAAQFQMTTTNFSILCKNAMNKVLAQAWAEYGKAGYNWFEQISTVVHLTTLNDVTWSIFGTVGSLPTVVEGAEYTPLKIGDNGETSSFVKKGGYFGVTLEAIDRDDSRALRQAPKELAFSAIRELSATVAALFTASSGAGPLLADSGRLFNATAVTTAGGHANLLTTALGTDYTAWEAVAQAMYKQPMLVSNDTGYIGTGKAMAVEPKFCLVPRALRGAANTLFVNRQAGYGVENLYYGQVFPITVPDFTDTTDWAAAADPKILPTVMIGERFGLMPEIFIAGNETDPAVFMNDESRIKVRHFSAVGIADWRGLHKSNVAGG